ncbi:hypothetical protein BcepIL02_gp05 [Burkholderia phage BcepIL02]|uniref:Uncharacterized protein n=1 Tax=Burkholderia phage BcepIL02 TaxID=2886898 RepID=C5IHJ7_9CAUD|nr:hypothetical protein BcepIL02_gp05 [Burkholderia phage BcepIL02]ACR14998.2 hypothetical protein BcepIL02_gp05 [Burkholderia phage BcepIL02]
MREVVAADEIEGDDGAAVVLSHQKESGVHGRARFDSADTVG